MNVSDLVLDAKTGDAEAAPLFLAGELPLGLLVLLDSNGGGHGGASFRAPAPARVVEGRLRGYGIAPPSLQARHSARGGCCIGMATRS